MTAELVERVRETGLQRVKEVVRKIAHDSPTLADLPPEQLEQIARVVVAETLKDDLRKAADLEKVPSQAERETLLTRASRTASHGTHKLPIALPSLALTHGAPYRAYPHLSSRRPGRTIGLRV